MIDAVTTNKTDFFRESRHFEYLTRTVLPELIRDYSAGMRRPLMVWSAGCSTGAEPYTLAMVLGNFAESHRGFDFKICGTDISSRVLQTAREATYNEADGAPIPMPIKKKFLLRSKDRSRGLIRIVPELRQRVEFKHLNFMDTQYDMQESIDIVFCRNVLIYFNRQTQAAVLKRLCRHLRSGGYLFTGHSETLNGFELPLKQAVPTVYRKTGEIQP